MGNYYSNRRSAYERLVKWVNEPNDSRMEWSSFVRIMMSTYGFDARFMVRLLATVSPRLRIENDRLVRD